MNSFKQRVAAGLMLIAGLLVGGTAGASTITMNFDGLTAGTSVHNYYDGGCSIGGFIPHNVDCGGPDYGVVWKGASAHDLPFNQPSNPNYMGPSGPGGFLSSAAIMDVAGGFDTGLSFYYSTLIAGHVEVYSGLDASGSSLAATDLWIPSPSCGDVPCWDFVDLSFLGTAKSVVFSGFLGLIGFDNVTLGASPQGVPEPAALGMFGFGALLIGLFAGLRRRAQQS